MEPEIPDPPAGAAAAGSALTGKAALVTGAARRVGASIARALHAAGADVLLHYRSSADDAAALAGELGPHVRVNAVAPGPVLWPDEGLDEALQAKITARTALKRLGSPEDVARACVFFATAAPYVTGQVLAVDGGRSIGW